MKIKYYVMEVVDVTELAASFELDLLGFKAYKQSELSTNIDEL